VDRRRYGQKLTTLLDGKQESGDGHSKKALLGGGKDPRRGKKKKFSITKVLTKRIYWIGQEDL